MKKAQTKRINKKLSTKSSSHLTSHISLSTSHNSSFTSERAITLISLVIYITLLFVVLAIVMRVMSNFRKNINDVADITLQAQVEKLNLFMLEETKKVGNSVVEPQDNINSISFSDGSSFQFIDEDGDGIGEVYFSEIKLCENINDCTFSSSINENGKTIVSFELTVNDDTIQMSYVMVENNFEVVTPENIYIIDKSIVENML